MSPVLVLHLPVRCCAALCFLSLSWCTFPTAINQVVVWLQGCGHQSFPLVVGGISQDVQDHTYPVCGAITRKALLSLLEQRAAFMHRHEVRPFLSRRAADLKSVR